VIEKGILNRHYSDRERAFLNGILSTAFYYAIVLPLDLVLVPSRSLATAAMRTSLRFCATKRR
jgi:hypothetical protein